MSVGLLRPALQVERHCFGALHNIVCAFYETTGAISCSGWQKYIRVCYDVVLHMSLSTLDKVSRLSAGHFPLNKDPGLALIKAIVF